MWNGTAATLKAKPTSSSARPMSSSVPCSRCSEVTCAPISARFVVPVAPYTRAIPYSRNAEAKAPSRKYLSAASAALGLLRLIPANTYTDTDISSSPRNTTIKSDPPPISIMPRTENSSST